MADADVNITHELPRIDSEELDALKTIERRLLWLSTQMIHHANNVRPNPEKTKVGGHQASSASVISIVTALYFNFLRAGDRVSIKPHASPAYHAAQYLLGNLDKGYLPTLRQYKGLGVSEPHQGPGPSRFFHRLRGARRGSAGLCGAGQQVCRIALG